MAPTKAEEAAAKTAQQVADATAELDEKLAQAEAKALAGGRTMQPVQRILKPVTGAYAKFEEKGDMAAGTLQGFVVINVRGSATPKYTLRQDDGEIVSFLGTVQQIEILRQLPVGSYVQIIYTGLKERATNGNVKIFEISVDESVVMLPPADVNAGRPALQQSVDQETGEIFAGELNG